MLSNPNDENTEWRDWEIFCQIVESGSFTRAADRVRIPRSTASASIARLEQTLGVRLLERNTRNVMVTDIGRSLFGKVFPLITALREIEAEARSSTNAVNGTLRISAPYEVARRHLSPAFAALMRLYPDLKVELDDSRELPNLVEQRYDIVLTATDTQLPDSSLVCRQVAMMDRAFYASSRLIAGLQRAPMVVSDIDKLPAIADSEDRMWDFYLEDTETCRIAPQVALRTPNEAIRVQAAIDGLGVARLPVTVAQSYVDSGELVRVLPAYKSSAIRCFAITSARLLLPPKVRALLKILEADNPKLTNILPPGGRNRLFGLEDSNRLVVFPLTGC